MCNTVTTILKYIRKENKMGSRLVTVRGIAEWAKVFPENRDMEGYDGAFKEFDGACTIDLIMQDEDINRLAAAGCGRNPKPDPQGRGKKIRFERRFKTAYDFNSGPPVVTKADGTPWSLQEDGIIGNGSMVEADITFFDTKRKHAGSRLDRVMVLDHVEYNTQPQQASGGAPPSTIKPAPEPVEEQILF